MTTRSAIRYAHNGDVSIAYELHDWEESPVSRTKARSSP